VESMPAKLPISAKPKTERIRPEITRLPGLTPFRKLVRWSWKLASRLLILIFTRPMVFGLDNFPEQGPAIVVVNHLGDADIILGVAFLPSRIDALAKSELYDFPLLGRLMDAFGVIWVHRGQPDRRAIRTALQGLRQNRIIGIAPEARESLTGSLEEGTHGAAFLALKTNVPLIPVTFTGTENSQVYGNMKRLRKTTVNLTVGKPFYLSRDGDFHTSVHEGTQTIMRKLAEQLPADYRGIYQDNK
jgi:1-acyl-sn-glycerol-3-phosphate acyltransferase